VDDSELMLLAFNTYEAFGALLGSPAAKAAKLTAMHMAAVIAHSSIFENGILIFYIRLRPLPSCEIERSCLHKMVLTVPVVLALACASAAPPPPLGVDVFTDGESGYKAFRIPGIAAAKGVVVVFAEGRKVRMPSAPLLYIIAMITPCTTYHAFH
jgi:hypothetical protein